MVSSNFPYILRLQTLRSFDYIKCYFIPFLQGFEAFARNSREMTENIFTIILLKKTKPLCVVKPFYLSVCHFFRSPRFLILFQRFYGFNLTNSTSNVK